MREVSALAEDAEQARAWEQKAQDLLKHAVELAVSRHRSRGECRALTMRRPGIRQEVAGPERSRTVHQRSVCWTSLAPVLQLISVLSYRECFETVKTRDSKFD